MTDQELKDLIAGTDRQLAESAKRMEESNRRFEESNREFDEEVVQRAGAYGIGIIKQAGQGVEINAENLKAY